MTERPRAFNRAEMHAKAAANGRWGSIHRTLTRIRAGLVEHGRLDSATAPYLEPVLEALAPYYKRPWPGEALRCLHDGDRLSQSSQRHLLSTIERVLSAMNDSAKVACWNEIVHSFPQVRELREDLGGHADLSDPCRESLKNFLGKFLELMKQADPSDNSQARIEYDRELLARTVKSLRGGKAILAADRSQLGFFFDELVSASTRASCDVSDPRVDLDRFFTRQPEAARKPSLSKTLRAAFRLGQGGDGRPRMKSTLTFHAEYCCLRALGGCRKYVESLLACRYQISEDQMARRIDRRYLYGWTADRSDLGVVSADAACPRFLEEGESRWAPYLRGKIVVDVERELAKGTSQTIECASQAVADAWGLNCDGQDWSETGGTDLVKSIVEECQSARDSWLSIPLAVARLETSEMIPIWTHYEHSLALKLAAHLTFMPLSTLSGLHRMNPGGFPEYEAQQSVADDLDLEFWVINEACKSRTFAEALAGATPEELEECRQRDGRERESP